MDGNTSAEGLYMTITLLEDRVRIEKNQGFSRSSQELYDEVMLDDIDLNHVECSQARSMLIQGYLLIPLNKKLAFPNTFNGKAKEIKLWFKTEGNESFERFKQALMERR
ncbi:hypothetical protein Ccar_01260 [Clostridium carboxidivorans P7]|uniref:Uncharacterized protein n=1 Tax=Clostridium carboxidivorans P7 TaxID=536227 RepID=C6PR57_9CLOT|nr:hypothetical protein [Clostridium carboxidivorans]AKN29543.1 hypothetical protein Ccar_01260 [Clostridium carboxidivorans P7]EET88281.1 hypothetical protein CcarbDRAFT_1274 [Clostridium carboxidivorans P7]EFG89531.1 hypothetical protein CLCAR_0693 [Clostridium carboxidivorans P7]